MRVSQPVQPSTSIGGEPVKEAASFRSKYLEALKVALATVPIWAAWACLGLMESKKLHRQASSPLKSALFHLW